MEVVIELEKTPRYVLCESCHELETAMVVSRPGKAHGTIMISLFPERFRFVTHPDDDEISYREIILTMKSGDEIQIRFEAFAVRSFNRIPSSVLTRLKLFGAQVMWVVKPVRPWMVSLDDYADETTRTKEIEDQYDRQFLQSCGIKPD